MMTSGVYIPPIYVVALEIFFGDLSEIISRFQEIIEKNLSSTKINFLPSFLHAYPNPSLLVRVDLVRFIMARC